MAADGRLVFTAWSQAAQNQLLFLWDSSNPLSSPRSIGDVQGYHTNPTVTLDGEWVYFAHNPHAHGPPGQHEGRAFAQIYRVRADGTGLEAVTQGDGCHFGPSASSARAVAYIHASCHVMHWAELLRVGQQPIRITREGETLNRVEVSPDDRTMLISVHRTGVTIVRELDIRSGKTRELFEHSHLLGDGVAHYGADAKTILFESNGTLLTWTPSRSTPVTLASGG